MAGKTIGIHFPSGIAGTVSRDADAVIETFAVCDAAGNPILPGSPVVLTASGQAVTNFVSTSTADKLVGFALRNSQADDPYGSGEVKFANGQLCDVLKRGTLSVKVGDGSPIRGGDVYYDWDDKYLCTTAKTKTVGEETVTITVKLTNCRFSGVKDANGVAQLTILERNC